MKNVLKFLFLSVTLFSSAGLAAVTTEEDLKTRISSIISAKDVSEESLDGLPEEAGSFNPDALCTMYKKLAIAFEDSKKIKEAAIALHRAAKISNGTDHGLSAQLRSLGVDPLNPALETLAKKIAAKISERNLSSELPRSSRTVPIETKGYGHGGTGHQIEAAV